MSAPRDVEAWLDAFAAAVRARDLEAGRALADPGCRSFGTRVVVAAALDELVREQWAHVWPATSGFAFDAGSVVVLAEDHGLVVVLATWRSSGDPDGPTPTRTGRSTIVLRRSAGTAHGLLAVHTHFSRTPRPAASGAPDDRPS